MKRLRLIISMVALLLVLFAVGCSSKLDDYSDSFNPLLEQHITLYSEDFASVLSQAEDSADAIAESSDPNVTAAVAIMDELHEELGVIKSEMAAVNREWSILHPPEEAQTFHNLAFEMMQLRHHVVEQTSMTYTLLAAGQIELSLESLDTSYGLHAEGERLLMTYLLKPVLSAM